MFLDIGRHIGMGTGQEDCRDPQEGEEKGVFQQDLLSLLDSEPDSEERLRQGVSYRTEHKNRDWIWRRRGRIKL